MSVFVSERKSGFGREKLCIFEMNNAHAYFDRLIICMKEYYIGKESKKNRPVLPHFLKNIYYRY